MLGVLLIRPYNADYRISGVFLGAPSFGKLPFNPYILFYIHMYIVASFSLSIFFSM